MKFSIFFATLFFAFAGKAFSSDPAVHWETYSKALETALEDNKMLFVDIVADWCIPCREMDKTTFRDGEVVKMLNEKFHPVRLDQASKDTIRCDGKSLPADRCFFDVWNLSAVPSYVLIAPKGMSILTYSDALGKEEMQKLLRKILEKEKEWLAQ